MTKRVIKLPQGGELEVDIFPGFDEALRKRFMLSADEPVTDDHVRMFFYGALNTALTKAETEAS